MDTRRHEEIFRNNLTVYLCNRLNSRLDAEGMLVSRLKELWEYITQELNIQDFDQRQECATRLVNGIVPSDMTVRDMEAYIWDQNKRTYMAANPFYHSYRPANYHGTSMTAFEQLISAIALGAHSLVPSLLDLAKRSTSSKTLPILRKPLSAAIAQGDVHMVRILLTCHDDHHDNSISETLHEKLEAVEVAIEFRNMEILKLMLNAFQPSDVGKHRRQSWIEQAIKLGSIPALNALLKVQIVEREL
jgi:hypothetical protein